MALAAVVCAAVGPVGVMAGNPVSYLVFMLLASSSCLLLRHLLTTPIRYGTWCLIATATTAGGAIPLAMAEDQAGRTLMWMLIPMLLATTLSSRAIGRSALAISAVSLIAYFLPKQLGWLESQSLMTVPAWQGYINALALFVLVYMAGRQSATAFQSARHRMKQANQELMVEASLHRETRERLEAAHNEVVRTARTAGMAEVATGVLHNVGNALNTVVVTSSTVRDHLANDSVEWRLERLATLLEGNEADPMLLVRYVRAMARQTHSQRIMASEGIDRLREAVAHVSTVIAAQQAHARCRGVVAPVSTADLVNDVTQLTFSLMQRHRVTLCIDDAAQVTLTTERHQVVQVLENVVRNAAEALHNRPGERRIHLTTSIDGERLRVQVVDNGPGVPLRQRDAVFQHGFTTKVSGSGFGLHVSALASRKIGGQLALDESSADSGASFSLWLPLDPVHTQRIKSITEVRSARA
jgi:signal transduction histidine kinase